MIQNITKTTYFEDEDISITIIEQNDKFINLNLKLKNNSDRGEYYIIVKDMKSVERLSNILKCAVEYLRLINGSG